MIDGVTNADSIPVLEQLMRFSGARHRLIAQNVANLSTPEFRPMDLSVEDFQQQLQEAVDQRRERFGPTGGPLRTGDGTGPAGELEAEPIGHNLPRPQRPRPGTHDAGPGRELPDLPRLGANPAQPIRPDQYGDPGAALDDR
ncbi:MAG: flagellar basal body rod protein FlgB [Planctomycetota bacterium]|jgi:flagellar basal-body rod protein FlgB